MKPLKTISTGAVMIFTRCFVALVDRSAASKSLNSNVRGDGLLCWRGSLQAAPAAHHSR